MSVEVASQIERVAHTWKHADYPEERWEVPEEVKQAIAHEAGTHAMLAGNLTHYVCKRRIGSAAAFYQMIGDDLEIGAIGPALTPGAGVDRLLRHYRIIFA